MRELSVFCDESGDFGALSNHSPRYIISLVLHDQSHSISDQTGVFQQRLRDRQLEGYVPIHTAPLIRRESPYKGLSGSTRASLFDVLFSFFRHCKVHLKVIDIDKRWFGSGGDLEERIARELGTFVRYNLPLFQSYDRVVVYYDRGQLEVSRVLRLIFGSLLSSVEFRTVAPKDYLLFQVTDLACTMQLVEDKRRESGLTKSEKSFFGSAQRFKKNYYREYAKRLLP